MSDVESLSHSRCNCKYHLVFVPKGRKKELFGNIRTFLGLVFHDLAADKGSKILEGHMLRDHVHMMIKIPSKYVVSSVIGYIKGKNAIAVARRFSGRKRNFSGEQFWSRGMRFLQLDSRNPRCANISVIKRIVITVVKKVGYDWLDQ